jgi:hypothetical protein
LIRFIRLKPSTMPPAIGTVAAHRFDPAPRGTGILRAVAIRRMAEIPRYTAARPRPVGAGRAAWRPGSMPRSSPPAVCTHSAPTIRSARDDGIVDCREATWRVGHQTTLVEPAPPTGWTSRLASSSALPDPSKTVTQKLVGVKVRPTAPADQRVSLTAPSARSPAARRCVRNIPVRVAARH